jgi:methyl-accepting chemotaxis protein
MIDYESQDEIGIVVNSFRELIDYIDGIARGMDALSQGLLTAKVASRSEQDVLSRNFIHALDAFHSLLDETNILIRAAREGKLNKRGNAGKFQGSYRELIEGMNAMLDAVVAPINEAAHSLDRLAARDLTARMQGDYHGDFAKIKLALNQAADELGATITAIGQNANVLAGSSEELKIVSQQMSANAEETSAQTNVVSAAAEEVSKSVQTVATGAEEMGASIREIAKNATEAAKIASQAVKVAETTNATVEKLGESSMEIGNVVKVITSIAEQTNLLALNATIEAARAGEAGKGFAVVANEVKELAKETAKATEDISRKIEAIQGDTRGAVEAITEIGGIIKQVNDIAGTIASAVEEQSATTNEITRNIGEAARGSSEIAQNITGIMQAAQSTTTGASDTQTAAAELSKMAAELQGLVGQFQYEAQEDGQGKTEYRETLPVRVVRREDVKRLKPAAPFKRSEAKKLIP